jgi:hypothetical protein
LERKNILIGSRNRDVIFRPARSAAHVVYSNPPLQNNNLNSKLYSSIPLIFGLSHPRGSLKDFKLPAKKGGKIFPAFFADLARTQSSLRSFFFKRVSQIHVLVRFKRIFPRNRPWQIMLHHLQMQEMQRTSCRHRSVPSARTILFP